MARTIESEIANWPFKIADDPIRLMFNYIAFVNYRLPLWKAKNDLKSYHPRKVSDNERI